MACAHPFVAAGRQPDHGSVAGVVGRKGWSKGCHGGQNKAFAGSSPGTSTVDGVSRGVEKVYN